MLHFKKNIEHLLARQKIMFQNISKFVPFHFILIDLEKEGMARKKSNEA